MANFKRGKAKSARAGCLMCKPNKIGQGMENHYQHSGFSKIREEARTKEELKHFGEKDEAFFATISHSHNKPIA